MKFVFEKKKTKNNFCLSVTEECPFFSHKTSLISDIKQMTHEPSPATKLITSVPIWSAVAPLPRDSHLFCGVQIKGYLQSGLSFGRAIMNENFRN